MKRLGMWNRLAIVAIILASLIAPSWIVLAERAEILDRNSTGYEACMKGAFDPKGNGTLSPEFCSQNWFGDHQWYPGWTEWWQLVGAVFALCIFAYLLLWAAVATSKWVWRGRQAVEPSP